MTTLQIAKESNVKWRREKLEPDEEFPIIMELSLDPDTYYMTFMVHWPTGGGYSWRSNLRAFLQSWEKQCHVAGFDTQLVQYLVEQGAEQFPEEDIAPLAPEKWSALSQDPELQGIFNEASTNNLNTEEPIQLSDDVSFQLQRTGLEIELLFTLDGQLLNRYKPELLSPQIIVHEQLLYVFQKQIYQFNSHGERLHELKSWGLDLGWIEITSMRQNNGRLIAQYHNKIQGSRQAFEDTYEVLGSRGFFEFSASGVPMRLCPTP